MDINWKRLNITKYLIDGKINYANLSRKALQFWIISDFFKLR